MILEKKPRADLFCMYITPSLTMSFHLQRQKPPKLSRPTRAPNSDMGIPKVSMHSSSMQVVPSTPLYSVESMFPPCKPTESGPTIREPLCYLAYKNCSRLTGSCVLLVSSPSSSSSVFGTIKSSLPWVEVVAERSTRLGWTNAFVWGRAFTDRGRARAV